jgi:hypothetical protein
MCQPCGALRAAILLDPNGPTSITVRDIEHAASVLAVVAPSLKAKRLAQFAGAIRGAKLCESCHEEPAIVARNGDHHDEPVHCGPCHGSRSAS